MVADVILKSDGRIVTRVAGSADNELSTTHTLGVITNFQIIWDKNLGDNGEYSVYMDNLLLATLPFNSTAATAVSYFGLKLSSNSKVAAATSAVDNIAIYSDVDLTQLVYEDNFESYIVDEVLGDEQGDIYIATQAIVAGTEGTDDSEAEVIDDSETEVIDDSETEVIDDSEAEVIDDSETEVIDDSETEVIDDSETEVIDDSEVAVIDDSEVAVIDDSEVAVIDDSEVAVIDDSEVAVIDDSEVEIIDASEVTLANYEWDFSEVNGSGPVMGDKVLQMSKESANDREIVDGANGTNAVYITQSEISDTYGYHYTTMSGTTDPLAAIDGVISMDITFNIEEVDNILASGNDLQLLENTDSNQGWKMIINKSSSKPQFKLYNGSGSTSVSGTTVLESDTYYHIAATYDNETAKIYVNGVLEGTEVITDYLANTKDGDKVYVGGGSNSSQKNLEGALDNVAFWTVTLTADEVAARATEFGF